MSGLTLTPPLAFAGKIELAVSSYTMDQDEDDDDDTIISAAGDDDQSSKVITITVIGEEAEVSEATMEFPSTAETGMSSNVSFSITLLSSIYLGDTIVIQLDGFSGISGSLPVSFPSTSTYNASALDTKDRLSADWEASTSTLTMTVIHNPIREGDVIAWVILEAEDTDTFILPTAGVPVNAGYPISTLAGGFASQQIKTLTNNEVYRGAFLHSSLTMEPAYVAEATVLSLSLSFSADLETSESLSLSLPAFVIETGEGGGDDGTIVTLAGDSASLFGASWSADVNAGSESDTDAGTSSGSGVLVLTALENIEGRTELKLVLGSDVDGVDDDDVITIPSAGVGLEGSQLLTLSSDAKVQYSPV
jgi:hypothetical protein